MSPAGDADGDAAATVAGVEEPPFRVEDEETVWSGRVGRVAIVRVAGPDGELHRREVVRHLGAVGVLPLHDDSTVTLLHQYRAPVDRGMWEIPAGLRDVEGEVPAVTARRELVEEAGLAATSVSPLARFHNSPGFSDELVEVFLATGLTEVADDRQGPEEQHMAVRRLALDEALAMVDDGRITDAKTVIALLRAARPGGATSHGLG